MRVMCSAGAEAFDTPEGVMRPLVFGKGLFISHLEIPAGLEVPLHSHPGEGALYCLSGEIVAFSENDEEEKLTTGTVLHVEPGEKLGVRNSSAGPATALLVASPSPANSLDEFRAMIGED